MKDEQYRFLSLGERMPARLLVEQVAWALGCQPHDVAILVVSRLLKPLGNPPPNGIKFFATADVLEHAKDRAWLVKMTLAINQHWHRQNAKKSRPVSIVENGNSQAFVNG